MTRFLDLPALERWLAQALDRERTPERLRAGDLSRMERLVERLGHPQRAVPAIHVAGTKGKGTTCATLASLLDAAGLRVGLHTSPHLRELRERVRLGARPAPDAAWLAAGEEVAAACEGLDPTWFERVTALAFVVFRAAAVDVAVHEVGLGGRFDATNVLVPEVTVITRIARDHVELLGETPALIAAEKAGIVKPGVPLVTGPEDPGAEAVILARAAELGAPVLLLGREVRCSAAPTGSGVVLEVQTPAGARRAWAPHPGGPGVANLALALAAAERFCAGRGLELGDAVGPGLRRLRWRGRFDAVAGTPQVPEVIVDGAHEGASARALAETWRLRRGGAQVVLLLALARDKPLDEVMDALAPLAREAVVCAAATPRAREPGELAAACAARGLVVAAEPDVARGLARAQARARALGASVLATGSLYLAGEVLAALGQETGAAWDSA